MQEQNTQIICFHQIWWHESLNSVKYSKNNHWLYEIGNSFSIYHCLGRCDFTLKLTYKGTEGVIVYLMLRFMFLFVFRCCLGVLEHVWPSLFLTYLPLLRKSKAKHNLIKLFAKELIYL